MNCPLKMDGDADLLLNPTGQPQAVREHIANCPECTNFMRRQTDVWSALDAFESQPISANFDKRLFERIDRDEHTGWARLFTWKRLWKPLVPVAAASAAMLAFFLVRSPEVQAPSSTAGHVEAALEAEQVEQALDDLEMLRQLAPAEAGSGTARNL